MKKLLLSKRQGSAILLAVVSIVILLAMGIGLLSLGFNSRILSVRNSSDIVARTAADAGLTVALFEMNEILKAKLWNKGTLPEATDVSLPYCDAVYSYKVTGDHLDGYVITSVGKSNLAQRTVYATTVLKGLFDDAVLTKANLILKSGTLIDGYNSLDEFDVNTNADIATQSTLDSSIILNTGVVVNGDVRVGLYGNPNTAIKDLGAKVAGLKHGATEKVPLPQITVPTTRTGSRRTVISHCFSGVSAGSPYLKNGHMSVFPSKKRSGQNLPSSKTSLSGSRFFSSRILSATSLFCLAEPKMMRSTSSSLS